MFKIQLSSMFIKDFDVVVPYRIFNAPSWRSSMCVVSSSYDTWLLAVQINQFKFATKKFPFFCVAFVHEKDVREDRKVFKKVV